MCACFMANLPWKQGLESTQMKTFLNEKNMANVIFWHMCDPRKNLASFFQIFGPFLGIYPPCLWLYLKKFPAQHFKMIKYQCTIANSNTDSLGWILGVEVFFSIGHCSGALWKWNALPFLKLGKEKYSFTQYNLHSSSSLHHL